jgi:hypothetical protein
MHTLSLFCFSYFSGRLMCFLPWLAWSWIILLPTSHVGMRGEYHHAQIVCWDRVLINFFFLPGLSLNHKPPE